MVIRYGLLHFICHCHLAICTTWWCITDKTMMFYKITSILQPIPCVSSVNLTLMNKSARIIISTTIVHIVAVGIYSAIFRGSVFLFKICSYDYGKKNFSLTLQNQTRGFQLKDHIQMSANITVTSKWARWRLKSLALRLFTQPFIQAQIKENIKDPRHWPLCGEFTADRWIPRTNGQ